jgi:hypothetical protein
MDTDTTICTGVAEKISSERTFPDGGWQAWGTVLGVYVSFDAPMLLLNFFQVHSAILHLWVWLLLPYQLTKSF